MTTASVHSLPMTHRVILMECSDRGATIAALIRNLRANLGATPADTRGFVAELIEAGHLQVVDGRYFA